MKELVNKKVKPEDFVLEVVKNFEKMYLHAIKGKVLDIGCADFREYSRYIMHNSDLYIGIDISEELLDEAKNKIDKHSDKAKLVKMSANEMDFPDNYFDFIVASNTLAYTNKRKVITDSLRMLKRNGIFLCVVNNTIDYSLFKIANPYKSVLKEILHSLIVIFNTAIFKIINVKLFHTTFSTSKEINGILNNLGVSKYFIWETKDFDNLRVINFYVQKIL